MTLDRWLSAPLAVTLWLATASTGCLIKADPPAGGPSPRGATQVAVSWAIKDVSGAATSCDAAFATVKITATAADQDGVVTARDEPFVTLAPCSAGSAMLTLFQSGAAPHDADDGLDPGATTLVYGRYEIALALTEPTGEVTQAESFVYDVDLKAAAPAVTATIYPHGGFVVVDWRLASRQSGKLVSTCAAVAVDAIEHRYRLDNDDAAPLIVDRYPCEHVVPGYELGDQTIGNGMSRALAPGDYIGKMYALSGGVEAGSVETSFRIEDGNAVSESGGNDLEIAGR